MTPVWLRTGCSNKHHANVPQWNEVKYMAKSMDHSLDEHLLTGALVKSGRSTRNKLWNVLIKKNLKIGPLALKELEQQHKQKIPTNPNSIFV